MSIPDTGWSLETADLPAKLKLSFSARVIMTDNISVFDWLINGSNGAVKHLDVRLTPLYSICEIWLPKSIEGLVTSWRIMYQLLPEQRGFLWRKAKVLLLLQEKNFLKYLVL